MVWNIVIAVCAGVAQFINAWLGWRVTSMGNPLTKRQRRIYDISFVAVGLVGLVFIGLSAYRGREERAHLQLRPDLRVKFSDSHNLWAKASDFLPVNSQMKLNVNYKNVGNGPATNVTHAGRVYIEPDDSLSSNRDAISKFEAWLKSQPPLTKTTLTKDETGFGTFEGDILTPEDFQNIISGRRLVYEVGAFWFDDDLGSHDHNICWLLRAPMEGGEIIFQGCYEHTDEK
jgi:hypothetical protein